MASAEAHVQLARTLHPRLLRFFTKFPPPQLSTATQSTAPAQATTIEIASNTSSIDPNIAAVTTEETVDSSSAASSTKDKKTNPFLPFRNPRTGAWHGPHYSLRRQAELYKLAKQHNVLSLMPEGPKHPVLKEQRRIEHGLRVQGTGEGRRVKGKAWERSLRGRLEERRRAMEGMPEMIRLWKERGHGRGWKKWPK